MTETSDNKGRTAKSEDLQKQIDELRAQFVAYRRNNPQPTRWYFLGIDHDVDHLLSRGLNQKVAGGTALAAKGAVLFTIGRMAYKGIAAWLSKDATEGLAVVEDLTTISDLSQAA